MNTENPVVLDLGSESIKAGYAHHVPSEQEPRIVTPSLVSVSRGGQRGVAPVVRRGVVTSWDCLESTLHYLLYDQLGWVKGDEGSALFVEPLFTGKAERERLTQLMFEEFNVAGLFVHDAPLLSLVAAGKMSGVSVDIGHGKVDVAAVVEGITHVQGAARLGLAGEELSGYLGRLLAGRGPPQQPVSLSSKQLGALKVRCCHAAPSADAFAALMSGQALPEQPALQPAKPPVGGSGGGAKPAEQQEQQQQQQQQAELPPLDGRPTSYTLPDGNVVTMTTEGAAVAEALLRPPLLGRQCPGLADVLLEVVGELPDASVKRGVLEHVLLCGGGGCIPGLGPRLLAELRSQLPGSLAPGLLEVPEYMQVQSPQYVPWLGGAVMAKLVAYQSHFLIKAEYEELGPSAVHRKCA